jgi:energy-coupling factor transporter transmembrane protein EcfT
VKIHKALKKERRHEKHFFILMITLFIVLPLIAFLSQIKSVFLWAYLGVIEILISISCVNKLNYHKLKFSCSNNKLKFKSGLFSKESVIICDKIAVVHTDKSKEEMDIILISTVRFRNKYLKPISKGFLKKYPEASEEYIKAKKINPENSYYFQIIRKGALKKYILLDTIYKNCVRASYTASAIENIKIAREQIEI